MNEEEIHKALEIIKQPITVNCKEYKYFDQENYDKLVSVYNNCLWFIRNFEQVNTTVERVQQENQQLKEQIKIYEDPDDLFLMFMWCDEKAKDKIKELQQRIEKAIGYINKNSVLFAELHKQGNYFINCNADKLLEILKGEENVKEDKTTI